MTFPVNLIRMSFDERGNLRLQIRREHLPGTVTDDLIKQRNTGPVRCILHSVRAIVPFSGEPLFRGGLGHCDVAD